MKAVAVMTVLAFGLAMTSADTCTYVTQKQQCFLFGLLCYHYDVTMSEYCVHGGWTDFVEVSRGACDKECGGGTQNVLKTRTCTKPAPVGRGKTCTGPSSMFVATQCNTQPCPINGGWTDFSSWEDVTRCTALCGGGTKIQTHSRSCTNPAPMYGGQECVGADKEERSIDCNTEACGDRCPENRDTYIAAEDDPLKSTYFRCIPGDDTVPAKAIRMRCPKETVWDQQYTTCSNTPVPSKVAVCTDGAMRADPLDCSFYLLCTGGQETRMACPTGTKYSNDEGYCDFEAKVAC